MSTLRQRSVVVSALLLGVFAAVSGCAVAPPVDPAVALREGSMFYATNGCAACHGLQGHGDGPVAKTLNPPPRDFRDQAAFKNGRDPDSVAKTLATGLTRDGGQMQSYAHLSERERDVLARFVISLRDVSSTGEGHDAKSQ